MRIALEWNCFAGKGSMSRKFKQNSLKELNLDWGENLSVGIQDMGKNTHEKQSYHIQNSKDLQNKTYDDLDLKVDAEVWLLVKQ